MNGQSTCAGLFTVFSALCLSAQSAVNIDYVPVGDPGNLGDPSMNGKRGGVAKAYAIDKYEVTNAQYAEFLNTVDPAGANVRALYNPNMSTDALGGITLVGGNASGGKYVVKAGHENKPVVYVSWFDAARMANWLGNGQGSGSTETGAYTLTSNTTVSGKRSANAKVFISSDSEWYKAAYYQPAEANGDTDGYWLYPTASNTQPTGDAPSGNANSANYNGTGGYAVTQNSTFSPTQDYLTDVGAFTAVKSYYGTYDQAGNVSEWLETMIGDTADFRGGSWVTSTDLFKSSVIGGAGAALENYNLGFRLAAVPEPTSVAILTFSTLLLPQRRIGDYAINSQRYIATGHQSG